MPTIEPWMAGAFDTAGVVYRSSQSYGLAVRLPTRKRQTAEELALRFGGRAFGTDGHPPHWVLRAPIELRRWLDDISPFVRGQLTPLTILRAWLDSTLPLVDAERALKRHYAGPAEALAETTEVQ